MAEWGKLTPEQRTESVTREVLGAIDGPVANLTRDTTWQFSDGTIVRKHKWHPTKNIEQAWKVQERIVALGLGIETEWVCQLAAILDPEREHNYGFDMT
ncbi:MAG: hypothetical protein E3J64_02360, partial [Anaerolineales bacterium]